MTQQKSNNTINLKDILPFYVLIASAGKGQRFGAECPKQYTLLNGKPLIRHSIEIFLAHPACRSVQVIIAPDDAQWYHDAVTGLHVLPPLYGGTERKYSIKNALKNITHIKDEEIILVHDAARPCLSRRDLDSLLVALQSHRAASLAVPVSATLRYSTEEDIAQDSVKRDGLWTLQTPQGFRFGDLCKAHITGSDTPSTDDTTLVSALGIPVKLVRGPPSNIKITYPEDFLMAEQFLRAQHIPLTGQGFDVHAFDFSRTGPVRLCGVDIPHAHPLMGHSDADVGLHALTDAILGAIGAGDIGRHFPPSNPAYKNMDSTVFLEHAVKMLQTQGGVFSNIDLTLICEAPKITPYAPAMRDIIARICTLPSQRVNIKATTTEQLGFTGRREGIAAQALVSITLPQDI